MSILWRLIAFIVSRRPIARWLIWRAQCTPYFHLTGYMNRWWLFNPYAGSSSNEATAAGDRARHSARRWSWLPSIRVHHILRADTADHPHDHPWDARTIILEGGYFERRHAGAPRIMRRGDTAPIRHGDFHHIEHVSPGGVWTLFITWDYQGSWGFLVNGVKVPWRVYEAEHQRHEGPAEAQPGDWVLVPREPTPEMANWFRADEGSATFFTHTTIQCADFESRYSAMLAAAQQGGHHE